MTPRQKRTLKAQKRSRLSAPKPKKQRSEADLLRLERYQRKQILFRKF